MPYNLAAYNFERQNSLYVCGIQLLRSPAGDPAVGLSAARLTMIAAAVFSFYYF